MIQLDRALYIKDSSSDFSTLRVSDEVELEAGTFPARFPLARSDPWAPLPRRCV